MVKKFAQYTFARPLASTDEAIVKDLGHRFADAGHRYQDLLTSIAQSAWARTAGVNP
jgi:hypothetical protein